MGKILGVATIDGALLATTFVAADAQIYYGEERLDGQVFLAKRRGEIAACVSIPNSYTSRGDLAPMARRGNLGCSVETVEQNGLTLVDRVYVHGARGGSTVWDDAVHHTNLPDNCRAWYAHVVIARMSAGRSDALVVPPLAERPEGEGDAVEINIIGDIGQGRYSGNEIAAQIEDAADRTIVVNINSHGGTVDDGLKIYRALVNHPNAVHVNVTGYAESMAAIVALSGDVRTIASDGRMYLHRPHLSAETAEADDLRKLAARLDNLSHEFAGIVAARTGQSIDITEIWIGDATYFNAGQAVAVGLCDVVNRDHAPAVPTAPRARFAAINGPYRSIRPAAKSPKLFQYTGKAIKAGEIFRHKGATFVAARATLAAPGCEPENDPDTWERVQC